MANLFVVAVMNAIRGKLPLPTDAPTKTKAARRDAKRARASDDPAPEEAAPADTPR